MDGIDSNGLMQKQTKMDVIARPTKATFAGSVSWEVKFRGGLNCWNVPPTRTTAREFRGCRQHFTVADRTVVIVLPAVPGRREREACLALRLDKISLRRPATEDTDLVTSVDVFVVDVAEVDPPADVEPLHWRLLTTHTVKTVQQAKEIVRWYRLRWTIEQVFRTLKSAAMQADDSQVIEARRFIKLAVFAAISAIRIMQIVIG